MRRYLRCPGAICCPARRALRAVLQPHPVLRRADRRRVEPTAPSMRRLGPPAGCGGGSVGGKPGRCLRVRHRCLCALPRGRSTGFGVTGFAIRSRRDRHRPRASPRSPNKPYRASLKPPDSPAATREGLCRTDHARDSCTDSCELGFERKSGAKTDVVTAHDADTLADLSSSHNARPTAAI